MQREKWNIGLLATVWSSSTPQPIPNLLFKSVENKQHTGYCHSHKQHSDDCRKRIQTAAWRQWPQTCNLDPCKQVNTSEWTLPPTWNYKKADWKCLREVADLYTKSIIFSKQSVNKNLSNFNSAVLKAAKESIPRGRRNNYKPYWNKTLRRFTRSWVRQERKWGETQLHTMWEGTPSWRLNQTKREREKKVQTQSSWKTKTASPNMKRHPKTLAGDNVVKWRQLRAGQNNTANHTRSCHGKGGSKRPCQSFWSEHSFSLSWHSQRCQDPDTGCAPKHS